MVVTADPHATAAACEVLERRGNAVDAAIAAQWVLNVVEPQSSGLGGGGFFLYYEAATKRIYAFDGREAAPAEAFAEMFLNKKGEPYRFKPERVTGGLPVGVPGTLKLLKEIHDRFGSKKFSFNELFNPAIAIAERGFPISERLAHFIRQERRRLYLFNDSRRIFLDEKGNPKPAGTILVQQDLAKTFQWIQDKGIGVFYEGPIAEDIVKTVRNAPFHPGFMKKEDLSAYKVVERNPVRGSYRGYDIFSVGPPSSGGTTLIEALHILELYNLGMMGHKPDGVHLLIEAQKLAFLDRNRFTGDPDFSKIPLDQLLSKKFAEERSHLIRFDSALPTGDAPVRSLILEGTHTSHISVVDAWGNMAAYTTTIEDIFGSGMMVAGRGFFLNNELTDFDALAKDEKGQLVPNAPEGDKRPRSSMTPVFIFKDGRPVLILGSPGGSAIIGTALNIIVNILDFQTPLKEALSVSRVVQRNDNVEVEPGIFFDAELMRELKRRGHSPIMKEAIGNAQAIYFSSDDEEAPIVGESDPRGDGKAMGY